MLPNHEQAYVPEPKLKEYLLSETHAVGKAKAKYFRSIGYTEVNADDLANALLMIAKSNEIAQGDIGAVVYCYEGGEAFEVEFITGQGKTVAVMTLNKEDVRLMKDKEILHAGKLQTV